MDVILIRHAEAGDRDASRWPDDDLRPLTPEGRQKQIALSRVMKRMGVRFAFLASSPLVRARETAEIIADVYGYEDELTFDAALGHPCSPDTVLRLLAKFPPTARVALVGHEPALARVAAALIGGDGARVTLKKSGVIGIAFEGAPALATGSLEFLLKPGHLKKLAR